MIADATNSDTIQKQSLEEGLIYKKPIPYYLFIPLLLVVIFLGIFAYSMFESGDMWTFALGFNGATVSAIVSILALIYYVFFEKKKLYPVKKGK
jgi:hypothetical protein